MTAMCRENKQVSHPNNRNHEAAAATEQQQEATALPAMWICAECGFNHRNWTKRSCKECKAPRLRQEREEQENGTPDKPFLKLSTNADKILSEVGKHSDMDWSHGLVGVQDVESEDDRKKRKKIESLQKILSELEANEGDEVLMAAVKKQIKEAPKPHPNRALKTTSDLNNELMVKTKVGKERIEKIDRQILEKQEKTVERKKEGEEKLKKCTRNISRRSTL